MEIDKARDILAMKENLRNIQACIADLIEQVGMLSCVLDDMLVGEAAGVRWQDDGEPEDVHVPMERFMPDEPAVSISHTGTNTFSQCPAPEPDEAKQEEPLPLPPEPEKPKKQGILSRLRKDPKGDIEKANREKMQAELEQELAELKKRR